MGTRPLTLAKDGGSGDGRRDYRKEAQEWAAGIKDKDTREYAAEAAELVLRKGFRLPRISFVRLKKTRGGLVAARYRSPLSFELGMGVIEINEHPDIRKDGGLKAMQEKAVEWGWSAQPNPILHEFGHMIDHYMHSTAYDTEIGDRFDRMDRDMVKKEVSQYAATEGTEFRAELISAILSGKTFTTDLLDAAYLDRYRSVEGVDEIYRMGSGEIPNTSMVERRFGSMMDALFHDGGASLKTELLDNPEVVRFIDSHSRVLDNAFSRVEMSDSMRSRLRASDWMFSGLKTFHELHEAFPSLLDENGERKPFERFLNDVQKIDETYNQNWLRAEYNFAGASAGMAARWEDFEEDGDRYYLQYRTAHDGRVRPEHAEMDGITLPVDDPFWDTNYPPNGWNCRCTVVQVLKADNEPTDRGEAYRRAESALRGDRRGMFRFNPGKEGRVFPAYNPYSVSACAGCPRSELKLARDIPANELCQACRFLQSCYENRGETYSVGDGTVRISDMVNRKDGDFEKLRQTAEEFARMGRNVTLTPKMTRPSRFQYECVYGSLVGTKYEGKCPDLNIDGLWYEHEGFTSANPKNAFRNMVTNGLKQSDRIIIDDPELAEAYMKRIIRNRIAEGQNIQEVWLRDKNGRIRSLYDKKSEE